MWMTPIRYSWDGPDSLAQLNKLRLDDRSFLRPFREADQSLFVAIDGLCYLGNNKAHHSTAGVAEEGTVGDTHKLTIGGK